MSPRKQSMAATARYYSRFLLQRTIGLSPLGALLSADSNVLPSANDKRRRSNSLIDNVIVLVALLTLTYVTASSLPDVFHNSSHLAPSAYTLYKSGHVTAASSYTAVVKQHEALYESERQKLLTGSTDGSPSAVSTLQKIVDKSAQVIGPALPNVLTQSHPIDSAMAVGSNLINKLRPTAATVSDSKDNTPNNFNVEHVRQQLRYTFMHLWHDGYAKHAFGADELLPVSNITSNNAGSLGSTAIESLDTAVLMGQTDVVKAIEQHIAALSFRVDRTVSSRVVNQQYLASLISAFAMTNNPTYLTKAVELADAALVSFDETPSLVQPSDINLLTGASGAPQQNIVSLADASNCMLEYNVLSHLTTNKQYHHKCSNVRQQLLDALSSVDDAPAQDGLFPSAVDIQSSPARYDTSTLQYTVDDQSISFYAALLKSYIVTDYEDQDALHAYLRAMAAIEKHLITTKTGTYIDKNPNSLGYSQQQAQSYAFVGSISNKQRVNHQLHAACSLPGLLTLGYYTSQQLAGAGRALSPSEQLSQSVAQHHLELAQQLANTCTAMYFSTQSGLAPATIDFSLATTAQSSIELNHMYDLNGNMFTIVDSQYNLDGEFLESLFVLWRVTHNQWYRDTAYTIYQSIEQQCRTPAAYSGLKNVGVSSSSDNWSDKLPSNFAGKTLKQLYLLFSDDKFVPLSAYVLNAYGHPFDIMKPVR